MNDTENTKTTECADTQTSECASGDVPLETEAKRTNLITAQRELKVGRRDDSQPPRDHKRNKKALMLGLLLAAITVALIVAIVLIVGQSSEIAM